MSTTKKFLKIVAALLLLIPLFVGSLQVFAATEGTVDVTVHKRVFEDEMPELRQNTGQLIADFGGEPLAGAGFTVYDVTVDYHTAMAAVIAAFEGGTAVGSIVGSEQLTTAPNGTTTFTNLPLLSDDKDAAYLFVETKTPAQPNIIQKAAPFILAMPIYTAMDATGVLNTDLHVYPKNVTAEDTKVLENAESFTTAVINGITYPNVQIGDILNYKLSINVPADITDFASFIVKDTPGAGMALAGTPNVVVAGLTAGSAEDYTVTTTGNVLTLTFDTAKLAARAGQLLTITYDMVLTEEALPDTPIENEAQTIRINGDGTITTSLTPPPKVVTGGKQFIKTDSRTNKALSDAKFKVKKGDEWGTFILNTKGEYALSGWGTEADATEIVAASDGVFKVIGLLAGAYELKETAAPEGYVLLAENVLFNVVTPGYGESVALRQNVANIPKGLLPSTGGTGIYAFLLIGSMMMLGAYIWFKSSKEQVEI